jgi:hypothetical protein
MAVGYVVDSLIVDWHVADRDIWRIVGGDGHRLLDVHHLNRLT